MFRSTQENVFLNIVCIYPFWSVYVCVLTLLQEFPVLVPLLRQLILLSNHLVQLLLDLRIKISKIRNTESQGSESKLVLK